MIKRDFVKVIGAGLAGCEAAFQLAAAGINVKLYDMKPNKKSPAHSSNLPAELVCSNSLKSVSLSNASGVLKKEMEILGSVVLESAYENAISAGGALAVDRKNFSSYILNKINENKLIEYINTEIIDLQSEQIIIIATGPLTSLELSEKIHKLTGNDGLYFYDAAAPVVNSDSIDFEKVFIASRYDRGSADYINCPMNKEEYAEFYNFLINAEKTSLKSFEKRSVFEGCIPVEIMASRGFDTLRFGPMKPVGLINPATGEEGYAVVQLRAENSKKTMYNLVGFQTNLVFEAQRKLLKFIPGLEKAEIERYGVMHRNTYIKSPGFLNLKMQAINHENLFFAGQLTGVEGYLESAASGIAVGIYTEGLFNNIETDNIPKESLIGSLLNYVAGYSGKNFQPMNANFGILPPLDKIIRNKKERKMVMGERAIRSIEIYKTDST